MNLRVATKHLFIAGAACAGFLSAHSAWAQDIYVGNWYAPGDIYEITPAGKVSTFGSNTGEPEGLVFDKAGNLFVSDSMDGVMFAGAQDAGEVFKSAPDGSETLFASGLGHNVALTIKNTATRSRGPRR